MEAFQIIALKVIHVRTKMVIECLVSVFLFMNK